jgi:NhaA family Na+:H+ antiporter
MPSRKRPEPSRKRTPPIERLLRPFQEFAHQASSGGILLLICSLVALAWANSPFSASYFRLWQTPVEVRFGQWLDLDKPLLLWINDGLMAMFFFLVGMEIKRELLVGELSSWRHALLPIVAALGGMVVPALIFAVLNAGTPEIRGWGVPMATDIAFSLGALALLGTRAPLALKVFLSAFAIIDDLGAVLVIALFYTDDLNITALFYALLAFGGMLLANRLGVRNTLVYFLIGCVMWYFMLKSGVHATIAGVLGAFAIPVRQRIAPEEYVACVRDYLRPFEVPHRKPTIILNPLQQSAVEAIERASERVQSPLQRLEHILHPWVAFLILPLFALSNAGVSLLGEQAQIDWGSRVLWGVALGLLLGKPVGILLASWLTVQLKFARLPSGVSWRHILGVGFLGGIGFTMSLFIAQLAYTAPTLNLAKIGILVGSLLAGIIGFLLLRLFTQPQSEP